MQTYFAGLCVGGRLTAAYAGRSVTVPAAASDGSGSNFCGGDPAGGSGDPPLRGNFGPAWYGGRCSHETSSVSPEPNEAPNTPQGRVPDSAHPPFMGTASSGAPRSRTLCHGWSEPGAAVKWHRPEFCTASGPSGPEGIKTGNRILCAGTSAERCRGIPRKRGSGGGSAGAVRRPRDSPGDPLVSFPSLGKKLAPKGENL